MCPSSRWRKEKRLRVRALVCGVLLLIFALGAQTSRNTTHQDPVFSDIRSGPEGNGRSLKAFRREDKVKIEITGNVRNLISLVLGIEYADGSRIVVIALKDGSNQPPVHILTTEDLVSTTVEIPPCGEILWIPVRAEFEDGTILRTSVRWGSPFILNRDLQTARQQPNPLLSG